MYLTRILRDRLLRHRILARFYSHETENPSIRSNVFSIPYVPRLREIPLTTYPNPLYSLSKEDLLGLSSADLKYLLSIPYKSVSETDKFCFNVLEIVHDNIVLNPGRAAKYILSIQDPETRTTIVDCLRTHFKDDLLRRSLVLYINNPMSAETRTEVETTLTKIVCNTNTPKEEAAQMGLSYLRKLAQVAQTNRDKIVASRKVTEVLMTLPKLQWAQLYACLLHLNMRLANFADFETIKAALLLGSNLDKVVARTGILDPKWKDVNRFEYDDKHKYRMVRFFTFNDLETFTKQAIYQKDIVNANLYLELMVTKFENTKSFDEYNKRLQAMLRTMLHHLMVFKGPQECIKFLKYMVESSLDIRPSLLLRILAQFRTGFFFEEALMLINYLHNEKLTIPQRHILTSEIMKVITQKFSQHPQVAVGYFASIFGSGDEPLQFLQDLHILELVYGSEVQFSQIKRADVHQDLQGQKFTEDALYEMYDVLMRKLENEQKTVGVIYKLFTAYMAKIHEAKESNDSTSIFHPENVSDDILCLFMNHLLRQNPHTRDDFDLVTDVSRYNTAKEMYNKFFSEVPLAGRKRKLYIVDLLTTSSLLYHRDIGFAVQLMKSSREAGIPLSFNQLYPFVMYHYTRGEYEQAQQWHQLLALNGVKAKNVSADRLVEIAKELNWPVKGSSYRSSKHKKNQRARQELAKISSDPLESIFGKNSGSNSDDGEATVNERPADDMNLVEELGAILHASSRADP